MAKLLVFVLLIALAVAVLSAPTQELTIEEDPAHFKQPQNQESHFSECEKLFTRDPSLSVPEDVYICSHECLLYKKYHGGYAENGKCRCC